MPSTKELLNLEEKFGAKNYLPLPVVLAKGQGAKVWDVDGKEYLDFLASYSAVNFGHRPSELVEALKKQADKLTVCSRAFHSEELCFFVKELAEFCGGEAVLPMNTGTEAVETAIKAARKWGVLKKGLPENKGRIICMKNNFHGRTISVISFSTEASYREGFGPFTPGFDLVEFGDLKGLEKAIGSDTIGVLMEPIQAEAGILIPPEGYLKKVKALCEARGILLILDEIQTGFGRTGKDFCYQHESETPDILILGKSLGGGILPVSAIVAKHSVMSVFHPGEHGSTFGGNPLACAVAREALRLFRKLKLTERSADLGEKALRYLREKPLPLVKDIRGKGLLIGIELKPEAGGARKYCELLAQRGVLCKETHENVIRIAPPLVISEAELMAGLSEIKAVLSSGPT